MLIHATNFAIVFIYFYRAISYYLLNEMNK